MAPHAGPVLVLFVLEWHLPNVLPVVLPNLQVSSSPDEARVLQGEQRSWSWYVR